VTLRSPARAIEYCLKAGGIRQSELDYVGFYDKPLLKLERILETYLSVSPRGLGALLAFAQGSVLAPFVYAIF
jgi:carbamoyltransferase